MKTYIFLFTLILLSACKVTCENVKVDETAFSESTKSFFVYNQGEQVTFSASNDSAINFTVDITDSKYFICQKVTCDPIDPYKSSYCEYIESPQKSIFLQSDSTLIGIEASVFAYEPETELLYDAVRLTLSHVNSTIIGSKITDIKFSNPTFDREKLTDIDLFVEERASVTLENKVFENVIICADANLALYFQENKGFVAIRIGNQTYFAS